MTTHPESNEPKVSERFAELRAAVEKMTPAPWNRSHHSFPSLRCRAGCYEGQLDDEWGIYPPLGEAGPVALVSGPEDATAIALLRNAVPALLAALTSSEKRIDDLEKENASQSLRLKMIAGIIERVDNRCMAADGPVTETKDEISGAEFVAIYSFACGKSWDAGIAESRSQAERIASLEKELDRAIVQLGGCLLAADGGATGENDCPRDGYGWTPAFERIKQIRRDYDGRRAALAAICKSLQRLKAAEMSESDIDALYAIAQPWANEPTTVTMYEDTKESR